jgi:hypothetical protein
MTLRKLSRATIAVVGREFWKMAAIEHSPEMGSDTYVEKRRSDMESCEEESLEAKPKSLWFRVLNWGVEEGGIAPIPVEKRTDRRYINLFTVWFTALLCLLP